ncbi:MAG: L-serine ammonia-lyase, iron-sulfur-dependent subunit beta [Clostridiales bacterium]|jgi:L-serine dehydratase|nr:L-serine ammonia-lyase, iron-sulfur-dependent subunit beta [Clostridiales bacterium]
MVEISIFEVAGPVMIGPSSSHTAGAARLSRVARQIAAGPIKHVSFGLSGSFAKTYKGHGTDRALVAGILGLREDDERLADSFCLAAEEGLSYDFHPIELDGFHENSVEIAMETQLDGLMKVVGSSIGGGAISIRRLNGFNVEFSSAVPTLVIFQLDKKGIICETTRILAENGINIGNMRVSRKGRGEIACCVIEADSDIPPDIAAHMMRIENVLSVRIIHGDSA